MGSTLIPDPQKCAHMLQLGDVLHCAGKIDVLPWTEPGGPASRKRKDCATAGGYESEGFPDHQLPSLKSTQRPPLTPKSAGADPTGKHVFSNVE